MCVPEHDCICPECDGKKKVKGVSCKRCKGTGIISSMDIGFDEIVEVAPVRKKR
jgi:DnaJ-class molecular chaperone